MMKDKPDDGFIAWLMRRFLLLVFVVAALSTGKYLEAKYLPVVERFDIQTTHWDGSRLTIWGVMDKTRPCRFDGLLAYYEGADGLLNRATVGRPTPKKSRPPILQRFGPIWIDMPDDYVRGTPITLWANHECHFMWMSTDMIAVFSPPAQ